LLVSAIAVAGSTACSRRAADPLEEEVERLRSWTLVPGARLLSNAPLRRGQWSAETTWEIEVNQSWPVYRAALERSAPVSYRIGPVSDGRVSYRKTLASDTWQVDVSLLTPGPPLRVRLTFTGRAE
jgi:hypothetical protein